MKIKIFVFTVLLIIKVLIDISKEGWYDPSVQVVVGMLLNGVIYLVAGLIFYGLPKYLLFKSKRSYESLVLSSLNASIFLIIIIGIAQPVLFK